MTRLARLAALVFLAWPCSAFAQPPLSLDQVVREALEHNRSLLAARAGARESDARVTLARAAFFPRVSFTETWQRGDQPVFVFSSLLSARRFAASNFAIDALNFPGATSFFRGAFSVEQQIFDGGRTRAAADSSRLQRDMAASGVDEAAAGLALSATQAFGRALTAEVMQRAAEAAARAAQEDLARAERHRNAGTMTDADVLALAVHLSSVRQQQIQAAGDRAVACAELNHVMGAPIDREMTLQEPAPPLAPQTASAPEGLFAEAEKTRPDLQRSVAAEQLAESGRRLAQAAWYPQIGAQAGLELAGTQLADRASSWIVGAEVRWTLSAGGAQRASVRAAAEAVTRARLEREDARAAAQVEIVTALRRTEAARSRLDVGRATVSQARESERIIRNRFDAGIAGANDVLRASSAVLDAEAQRVAALVDAIVSQAMLDRAIGRTP